MLFRSSLHRVANAAYGNDPVNWHAAAPANAAWSVFTNFPAGSQPRRQRVEIPLAPGSATRLLKLEAGL